MEMKKVLLASSAALALGAVSSAHAGSYFTVFGGATFQSGFDAYQALSTTGSFPTTLASLGWMNSSITGGFGMSADLDAGFVLGAAYGRDLNQHWRWELEMAYRESPLEGTAQFNGAAYWNFSGTNVLTGNKYFTFTTLAIPQFGSYSGGVTVAGPTTVPVDGSTSFFSIMSNFWYDFNIVDNWETFVGVGIGMAQANVNGVRASIPYSGATLRGLNISIVPFTGTTVTFPVTANKYFTSGSLDFVADGSDWVFAYQFGIGAGYTLENGVRLSAQYRYFGTDEAEIDGVTLQGESNEFLFGISFPLGN